ncbi:aminotransferase class I and II family protein [Pseudomonas fluorescens]|uniref:Aminotransferase n=1 Tax=Pseudomonas fluorescens TaxID=294 RepID=A0A0P8ZQV0_PSEFL|nr:amino acid aminotransferase [Pseudomonas fluorescens]KPU59475.1 aminotransferase class I and II family protein [Pseudomonas fluorescens]
MFSNVAYYHGDPIYSLFEEFVKDPRAEKVSLSVGVYCNEDGSTPYMKAVQLAEHEISQDFGARPYLPMEGMHSFRVAAQALVLGDSRNNSAGERVVTIQSVGATGAVRVGADFLKHNLNCDNVWISDFTWETHDDIFKASGYQVNRYPYYDARTGGVNFNALVDCLEKLPAQSVVVLHACAHNPTGAELSNSEWDTLSALMARKGLIPLLDMAYQGFSKSLEKDAYALRSLFDAGASFLVANSFSKNFSLYGERVGNLSIVCPNAAQARNVLGQLKAVARRTYSSPPTHGARIIEKVLTTPALRTAWEHELDSMRARIQSMRTGLYERLVPKVGHDNVAYLPVQSGMFSFTGLNAEQIKWLRDEKAIYLVGSGRICLAGLTPTNLDYVAESMALAMTPEFV